MYKYPCGAQSVKQLDWKQLGLLAAKAILEQDHEVLVNNKLVSEPVLAPLIFKGTMYILCAYVHA